MNASTTVGGLGTNLSSSITLLDVPAFKDSGHGPSGVPIVHLLGPEFTELIAHLLHATIDAKQSEMKARKVAENLNKSKTEKEKLIGFPSRFVAFVADMFGMRTNSRPSTPGPCGMDPAEKVESDKTLQYLDFSLEKLSSMFELKNVVENLNSKYLDSNLGSDVADYSTASQIVDNATECIPSNGLSPMQRR